VEVARAGIRYRVEVAYGLAAGATALHLLSSQAMSDGQEMLRIAEAREASGDAAELDVALARVALGELHSAMLSDSLAALDAALSLQSLLGMPQDRVLLAPGDSLADFDPPPPAAGGAALRLRAADSIVASEQAGLTLARRRRFPAPALRFGFERGDPTGSEPGTLPTVGVTIPLPIFDRGSAQVASAEAALMRARAERLAMERDVESALPAAHRRWEAARARIAVDQDAVQSARNVAELAQTAYREGAYTLASVLEAQRSARDTLRRLIEDLMAGREAAAAYRLAVTAGGATP
jgi:cobalt-zinc-cadmium efflux system outer membrane protein